MKLLIKLLGITFFSSIILVAGEYSYMSTEDMIGIRANVPVKKHSAFKEEMQKMSQKKCLDFKLKHGLGQILEVCYES